MSEGPAPLVSVLLPVYDGEAFLREAIDSILQQGFRDFELLVIDDGSTDASAEIAASYRDPRVRLVRNGENQRLIRTLNRGLSLARGRYVARMDADDVSLPERLARQVAFLEAHPEVGACGAWIETLREGDSGGDVWTYPTGAEEIRCRLLFDPALAHPTVCLRREAFARHDLRFDEAFPHAEDYALWRRASQRFPLANLPEVLLRHRLHAGSVSQRHRDVQETTLRRIHREALAELGLEPSQSELDVHRQVAVGVLDDRLPPLRETERWLSKLLRANREHGTLAPRALEAEVGRCWLRAAQRSLAAGRPTLALFLLSPLSRQVELRARARLLARTARRALARGPRTAPPPRSGHEAQGPRSL